MSNSYFNRAKTAKNRIGYTDDVIELVDSSKHIYYVRTNQHEYLVDLSFSANSVLNDDGTLKVENGHYVYTVDRFDLKLPTDISSGVDYQSQTSKYIDLIEPLVNLTNYSRMWNGSTWVAAEDRIPSSNSLTLNITRDPNYQYISGEYILNFSKLGVDQYRDFESINKLNSTIIDPAQYKWLIQNELVYKLTPITYCVDQRFYGLSWGLPNIEVLSAVIFNDLLKDRVVSHFGADVSKNIVVGAYTQYFIKVNVVGTKSISDIELLISLNNIGTDITPSGSTNSNYDLLGLEGQFDSAASTMAIRNASTLITGTASSIPNAMIVLKNLISRLGIWTNDGVTDNLTKHQVPMLIIPTAIIR